MATYPFQRAVSLGHPYGAILTSTQFNTVDDNAASGASGTIWTDFMLGRTWVTADAHSGYGYSPIWRPYFESTEGNTNAYGGTWYSFGVNAGNFQYMTCEPFGVWQATTTATALTPGNHRASAVKPDGSIIICGGNGTGTGNIMEQNGANPFTARNTVGTGSVTCAIWHSGSSKFVIGADNTATTNIETSSDGQTWTQITGLPNSDARGAMATNGTIIVCMSSTTTDKCITSTTGATGSWTERTLPASKVWQSVVWDDQNDRFIAFCSSGGGNTQAYSSDGITWSSFTSDTYTIRSAVSSIGRVLIGSNGGWALRCGHFNGTALIQAGALTAGNTIRGTAAGDYQFLATDFSGNHYRSICGGTPF